MAPFPSRRLTGSFICAVLCLTLSSLALRGQETPPQASSNLPAAAAPDPAATPPPVPDPAHPQSSSNAVAWRDVSWSLLPSNFLQDQQTLLSFPRQLAEGRLWAPVITVSAATVALLSADPRVDPYFARTSAFRGFDRVFASNLTGYETILAPASLYFIGRYTHDSYMEQTALFAAEAVADSEVLRAFLNSTTRRWRPQDIFGRRTYSNTFFNSRTLIGSSFPSGHMIAAVSVATVIARRYRRHRWVTWAAYGLAGTIGFSRLTLLAHFPSDVFLGSVLGYAVARYEVLENR
jgi:membrane-associated phospholipid phosphatase